MAAVLYNHARALLPSIVRTSVLRPFFTTSIVLASSTATTPALGWTVPSLRSLLDLFPPFLLAVPKKKTSHSRKAMRSANKGLKDKRNISNCPGCGTPKLSHHLCSACYSYLNRMWKSKNRTSIPDLS